MKILFTAAIIFMLANISCTKCVKCTEKTVGDSTIVEYPETCGNWRKTSKYEERVHAQALTESNVVCEQKSKIPFANSY